MSRTFIACLSSAALLATPFLFPMLFPLAWVAFLPLFRLLSEAGSLRRAFLYGWMTGWLAYLFGFHWLVYTISVFGGFSYPVSGLIFLLFAALEAFQFALLAMLVYRFGLGPLNLFPALFLVALEFWFPLLFPWYFANSQTSFSPLIQSADLVGPYGVSFLLMWLNATVYKAAFSAARQSRRLVLCAALLGLFVVGSLVYGFVRLGRIAAEIQAAPKIAVAAIQGNIDIGMKWDPEKMKINLESYQSLTEQVSGVALVIWPETAVEQWLPDGIQQLAAELMPRSRSHDSHFIFGARSFRGNVKDPDFQAYNSAFLTDGNGRVLSRYHKQVLLAFGEYIPFATVLSQWFSLPFSDGFTPGDGPYTLDLSADRRIAPLVCYEDLLPELSRRFVRERKANILVNLTNDAWYGKTVAPWQHARLAQWRAIETRRSLLRVTNTGVTTVINAKGEMLRSLPLFTPSVLSTQVEVLEGETLYVRFGDWFAWGVTLLSIGIVLFCSREPRRLA
jgi:apolipoprotein N-acyltransferase